jgi:nitroimidazol reductase NimA-like FMN-containing flavoprotein (pyridoxamine 5'-phosphate oxidase superfamily)
MTAAPRVEQLTVPPEYGTPTTLLDWETVERRLREATQYWLATVRPDGRPHVVPLDGMWRDDGWYFGGVPTTVKHANLSNDPRAALHLPDPMAATIVEGTCAIEVPSDAEAEELAAAMQRKYGYGPPAGVYRGGVWVLRPAKVMAWSDLTTDPTRFRL